MVVSGPGLVERLGRLSLSLNISVANVSAGKVLGALFMKIMMESRIYTSVDSALWNRATMGQNFQ